MFWSLIQYAHIGKIYTHIDKIITDHYRAEKALATGFNLKYDVLWCVAKNICILSR